MNELKGLSWKEATKALRVHGHNHTIVKRSNLFFVLISQFKSLKVLLLTIIATVFLLSEKPIDSLIVFLILILNIALTFLQAYRAKNTYQTLERLITSHVLALRNGVQVLIDKTTVVPGDIIFIKKGDIICADAYVLYQSNFCVNESNITGSDTAINKNVNLKERRAQKDGVVYCGSQVIEGSCIAKVFATGKNCKYGISYKSNLSTIHSEYEINLRRLNDLLVIPGIILLAGIYIINLITKQEYGVVNIILFSLALAVVFIPNSLLVIANLALTKSVLNLSNKNIIVKNNLALEKMGNIDLICTDKTGTITLNKLRIDSFHSGIDKNEFFKYSYLSCAENSGLIDKCILTFLKENNVQEQSEFMLEEIPFDSQLKFSARKFKDFEIIKGAPEYITNIADIKLEEQNLINENKAKGLQAISFAINEGNTTKYIGSFFFYEQIRQDAEAVIQQARSLGIAFKIITQDSKEVSAFVAKKVDLIKSSDEVIAAEDLDFDNQEQLFEQLTKHSVFASCNSKQKLKIIECLQTKHYVGYLGDGVNDSHSMAIANVDIAINSASDIAKQQSDVILLSNDLKVIINGIKENRITFENLEKYIRGTLTGNLSNIVSVGLVSPFINFLPLLPIQILISSLFTNVPLLSITDDNNELNNLKSPKQYSLNKTVKFTFVFGAISTLFDLIFFYLVRNQLPESIQTQLFVFTIVTGILITFSLRTRKGIFSNNDKPTKVLTQLSILSILITVGLAIFGLPGVFAALSLSSLILIIVVTAVYFVFTELVKTPLLRLLKL